MQAEGSGEGCHWKTSSGPSDHWTFRHQELRHELELCASPSQCEGVLDEVIHAGPVEGAALSAPVSFVRSPSRFDYIAADTEVGPPGPGIRGIVDGG